MYRATNLMAQYPNICGIAFEPFDNKQCENLMAKMRNVATARRFGMLSNRNFSRNSSRPLHLTTETLSCRSSESIHGYLLRMDAENRLVPQTLGSLLRQMSANTLGTTPPHPHSRQICREPAQVRDVRPTESRRDHILTLSNGKELPLSRTYKRNLTRLPVKVPRSRGEHPEKSK